MSELGEKVYPPIHQVSDGIKDIMYYQVVNVIQSVLEERMGPNKHFFQLCSLGPSPCYIIKFVRLNAIDTFVGNKLFCAVKTLHVFLILSIFVV